MRRSVAKIGYFLSCEQFGPKELVEQAKRAEAAGFEALWVSDHFHPWNDEQGQSPFVWGVIGAVSEATSLPVTTAVTCPTIRIHPAIIAQASATAGVQLDGKFVLGRRQRRSAQRTRARPCVAVSGRSPADARGGRRRDPAAAPR
jgi:G6PDH family F420-dependent oxidoreductase